MMMLPDLRFAETILPVVAHDLRCFYSTGPLPAEDSGPGLDKVGPDGSTKTVKAVPCSTAARETDGSTTCVGIPDESARAKKNR